MKSNINDTFTAALIATDADAAVAYNGDGPLAVNARVLLQQSSGGQA